MHPWDASFPCFRFQSDSSFYVPVVQHPPVFPQNPFISLPLTIVLNLLLKCDKYRWFTCDSQEKLPPSDSECHLPWSRSHGYENG